MAGGVNIKVKFDIDKAVKKSIGDLKKGLEGVSKSIDSVINKIETGFGGIGESLSQNLGDLFNVDNMKGLKQVEQAMNVLKDAYKNNKIEIEQYLPLMDKLNAKYNELAVSATSASTKIKGNLPTDAINAAKEGGLVSFVDKMDVVNLQQIIALSKQELGLVSTTGAKRERLGKQLDAAKAALKNLTLSDKQRAELAERDLKTQERKTAQLERQATAKRRADGDKQYKFAMAMESKSLEQIIAKTKELEFARKKLDSTTADGKAKIASVNKEMERLKIQQDAVLKSGLNLADANGKTSRSFRELAQMAGAYFSVYAVRNFISEVANVTGEFELQRIALGALVQDSIAANTIFEKIKATAIKSPFSVMQLTSSTKQLAAYRIEAEKLFDTTMMLSDVSAGLGVPMERLILAFGQIRAASVLRGQEVRQLTEAGIPIISLLADKFGELENRVVSTGEVFDKISNRLVPFEMINEIFEDMTAKGGMFYEMQKIQAETIKGRLVNLTDAYQLFLDKMGTANSGIIKGFIGGLEGILSNMDSILVVLKGLIAGFITYKTAMFALNIATGQNVIINKIKTLGHIREAMALGQVTKATVGATLAANGLNAAFYKMILTNPWVALATAIAAVATTIGLAVYNTGKFNRELEKIETKGIEDVNKLYNTFERLVGIIKDNSASIQDQNAAFEELKRTYKDILPEQLLNIENIKNEAIAYDQVKAAIYAKIRAQVDEQKANKIVDKYGKKLADQEKDLTDEIIRRQKVTEDVAAAYISLMKEQMDAGANAKTILEGYQAFFEDDSVSDSRNHIRELSVFFTTYRNFNNELNKITQGTKTLGIPSSLAKHGYRVVQDYKRILDHLDKIKKNFEEEFATSSDKFNYQQQQSLIEGQREYLQQQIDLLEKSEEVAKQKMAENLRKELQKILGTEDQQAIKKNLEHFASQFGVTFDKIRPFLKGDQQGFKEWTKSMNDILDERTQKLKQYRDAIDKDDVNVKGLINNEDVEDYENVNRMLRSLLQHYNALRTEKSTSGNTKDPLLNAIKQEISLIERLNNEYEKLLKEGMKVDVAKAQVGVIFKDSIDTINKTFAANKIKPIDFASLIEGDPQSILSLFKAQFESLKGNREASKALSEAIGKLEVQIKIAELDKTENEIKTFLEDIKKKYEISLEINEAQQGTRDLLMKMFGINENDIINDIGSLMDMVNEEIGKRLSEQGVTTETKNFASLTTEQFNEMLKPFQSKEGYGDIAKGLIDMFNFVQEKQKAYIRNTAKAYGELLKNYADFNDQRILVAETAEKEISALDARYKLAGLKQDANYFRLKQAILNKSAKETAKINYEELKQSQEYIDLFDRIEVLSEDNLIRAYTKVRQGIVDAFASGTISLKQFKSQLSELDKQFQSFYKQMSNFSAFMKGGFDELFKNLSNTAQNITSIAAEIGKMEDTQDPVKFASTLGQDKINYLKKQGIDVMKIFTESGGKMGEIAGKVGEVGSKLSGVASKAAGIVATIDIIFQNIYLGIKSNVELFNSIKEYRESINASDEKTTSNWEKTMEGIGQFNEETMRWWERLKSGDIAGATSGIITSWINLFTNFNRLGDKQIQENIDATSTGMDRLTDAIARMQREVDKQLGSDWLAGMNEIAEGYIQMAEYAQEKIDAAKGMKDPDEDEIYKYEQELLDAEENYKETIARMVEELTGADLKSAAEDFANIWLDAFLQGEDAMAAIENRFDQMIKNMVVKAIASKMVAGILQKTFDAVEAAVDDGDVTQAEIDRINAEGDAAMILINERLGALGGWFQDLLGTGGSAETLQKGIQGVTEQTAGIIEGYLNTIRYEIFKHTNILTSIQSQMQMNNNIGSDILYQATLSYQVLVAIRNWQDSITTTDNGLPAIRVV